MLSLTALLILSRLALAQEAQQPRFAQVKQPPAASVERDFDLLVTRLKTGDVPTRKAAISALAAKGGLRAVPHLGALLLDRGEAVEIRAAAAGALGALRNWRAVGFLKDGIKDPAREIRFAAALALGKIKAPETPPLLSETLAAEGDWWVRFAAAVALGENRDPRAALALARAAQGDGTWQVRLQAVRSLGRMGSRDAVLALGKSLHDPDPSVRAASAMALGDIGGNECVNLLAQALREETAEFPRQTMAEALRKLLPRQ